MYTDKAHNAPNKKQGLIKTVIVIVGALFLLAYFGFDLKEFFESERASQAMDKTIFYLKISWDFTWQNIIKNPSIWVWDKILVPIVWEKAILPVWNAIR